MCLDRIHAVRHLEKANTAAEMAVAFDSLHAQYGFSFLHRNADAFHAEYRDQAQFAENCLRHLAERRKSGAQYAECALCTDPCDYWKRSCAERHDDLAIA